MQQTNTLWQKNIIALQLHHFSPFMIQVAAKCFSEHRAAFFIKQLNLKTVANKILFISIN